MVSCMRLVHANDAMISSLESNCHVVRVGVFLESPGKRIFKAPSRNPMIDAGPSFVISSNLSFRLQPNLTVL